MADWRVIENTGQTLVGLVERHVAQLGIPNVGVGVVTPMAFPSLADTTDPFVSLFLYQIAGNAEMRGNPRRVLANGTLGRQPLPLELCYLVTAWGVRATDDVIGDLPATQDEARLLGAVLQAFYDNAELDRSSLFEVPGLPVWSPEDGLQIVMETLPVDGHYRIWDATKLGYRLSLVYRVRVAALEPTDVPQAPPTREAMLETVP
ncbi:DUF4255 domain-containing protein [Paracoccus sp. DMF]|uniref:DUF4255 domain-containing protein n=1 Tax=Paracoccus sp. DMF TaxID=400837 RepID=UPI0021E3BAEA|nr:DUF4255 domain-containing protein [Paracoccus sp. DMF]MCV2446153.1 DUF4255 domain-containing protein [Paracoccus sp. DMF]